MQGKEAISLEEILNHPQVKKFTDDISAELLERKEYAPPQCEVFSHPFTVLQDTDRYRFELDREAEKQLPNIIGNKVQLIEGKDSVDDVVAQRYSKKRNIGIVFSGGPAPGGHNVIAGLYDAAILVLEAPIRYTVGYQIESIPPENSPHTMQSPQ